LPRGGDHITSLGKKGEKQGGDHLQVVNLLHSLGIAVEGNKHEKKLNSVSRSQTDLEL